MKTIANVKNFDLNAALKGKPVVTRNGNNVRVVCVTNDNKLYCRVFSHVASYLDKEMKYCLDGKRYANSESFEDLFMAV